MIGVLAPEPEWPAVQEFFQLFKTPWESFVPGRGYDAVLATLPPPPDLECGLVIISRSELVAWDQDLGVDRRSCMLAPRLDQAEPFLATRGSVLTFNRAPEGDAILHANGQIAAFEANCRGSRVLRLGYDLFREVEALLAGGQPAEFACLPSLDRHIDLLRRWIAGNGVTLLEIPPVPANADYFVCLTHDIDFVGIRRHKFDHTLFGFLYRSTIVALQSFLRGRISIGRLWNSWWAALSLPLVHAGLLKDFWLQFEWFLRVEKGLPATYFVIPFRGRAGERVAVPNAARRASPYGVADIPDLMARWQEAGCEIGVHGIDAWHDISLGRAELSEVGRSAGGDGLGIRMHWLLRGETTYGVLDQAGFKYDSTMGYNETVGYRCGTTQVFRPLGTARLLEVPLHIQDGALFYPERLGLSDEEAWIRCQALVDEAHRSGGVLTILWHDRSPGPERFWGDFYERLVGALRDRKVIFASAGQAGAWFQQRRDVRFERIEDRFGSNRVRLCRPTTPVSPGLVVRVHRCAGRESDNPIARMEAICATDTVWTGESNHDVILQDRESETTSPALHVPAAEQSA